MNEEATRRVVSDLYAAYLGGDGKRMAALIDDDIDWVIYEPVQVFPFAGHRRGKDAVLEALAASPRTIRLKSMCLKSPSSMATGPRSCRTLHSSSAQAVVR